MQALLTAAGLAPRTIAKLVTALGSEQAVATATEAELRAAGAPPKTAGKLAAALALGRTYGASRAAEPTVLGQPKDAYRLLAPRCVGLMQEIFLVIAIDVRNGVLGVIEVARGTVCGVEVHPREVFRPTIRLAAAGIVLAHNHPSGDPTPSPEDIDLTKRLRAAGAMLGIPVIDHVVIGDASFRSLAEWMGKEF